MQLCHQYLDCVYFLNPHKMRVFPSTMRVSGLVVANADHLACLWFVNELWLAYRRPTRKGHQRPPHKGRHRPPRKGTVQLYSSQTD